MTRSRMVFTVLTGCLISLAGCAEPSGGKAAQDQSSHYERAGKADATGTYPAWAYDKPESVRPCKEPQPLPRLRPTDPLHYITSERTVMVRQPSGYNTDETPRISVWWTADRGANWRNMGYYSRGQSFFPVQVTEDGDFGVRFIGPGQPAAVDTPAQPERIYHVDSKKPEVTFTIAPQQSWYNVGDIITLSWKTSDNHLLEYPVRIGMLMDAAGDQQGVVVIRGELSDEGQIQYTIPEDALNHSLTFRAEAQDRAGNLGLAYSSSLQVSEKSQQTVLMQNGDMQVSQGTDVSQSAHSDMPTQADSSIGSEQQHASLPASDSLNAESSDEPSDTSVANADQETTDHSDSRIAAACSSFFAAMHRIHAKLAPLTEEIDSTTTVAAQPSEPAQPIQPAKQTIPTLTKDVPFATSVSREVDPTSEYIFLAKRPEVPATTPMEPVIAVADAAGTETNEIAEAPVADTVADSTVNTTLVQNVATIKYPPHCDDAAENVEPAAIVASAVDVTEETPEPAHDSVPTMDEALPSDTHVAMNEPTTSDEQPVVSDETPNVQIAMIDTPSSEEHPEVTEPMPAETQVAMVDTASDEPVPTMDEALPSGTQDALAEPAPSDEQPVVRDESPNTQIAMNDTPSSDDVVEADAKQSETADAVPAETQVAMVTTPTEEPVPTMDEALPSGTQDAMDNTATDDHPVVEQPVAEEPADDEPTSAEPQVASDTATPSAEPSAVSEEVPFHSDVAMNATEPSIAHTAVDETIPVNGELAMASDTGLSTEGEDLEQPVSITIPADSETRTQVANGPTNPFESSMPTSNKIRAIDLTHGNGLMIPMPATVDPAAKNDNSNETAHPWRVLTAKEGEPSAFIWTMPSKRLNDGLKHPVEGRFLADNPALRAVAEPASGSRAFVGIPTEDAEPGIGNDEP